MATSDVDADRGGTSTGSETRVGGTCVATFVDGSDDGEDEGTSPVHEDARRRRADVQRSLVLGPDDLRDGRIGVDDALQFPGQTSPEVHLQRHVHYAR